MPRTARWVRPPDHSTAVSVGRAFTGGPDWRVNAIAVYPAATVRWLTLSAPERPVSDGHRRVGQLELDAVRSTTSSFMALDNQLGGGRVRSAVVQYLHSEVASLLTGSYSEHVGRGLFSAVAEALSAAEAAFTTGDETPGWLDYFDKAYLAAKVAHCLRDLGDDLRTRRYATQSLQMADGYQRGRAFNLCLLASAHARRDPDEAVRVGAKALDIVRGLSSRRSHSYLRDLCQRLQPHTRNPDVAEFRADVAAITRRA